ncbi:hypothetical protein [Sphaerimonospora thailandensis]|nr:hypothetical protein [Sphaerimonospora thailandensis]
MSMADERRALDRVPSLFDHASRLHRLTPDQPLPDGGRHYPPGVTDHNHRDDITASLSERRAALLALLEAFFADPVSVTALHDGIRDLPIPSCAIDRMTVEGLPWLKPDLARETGSWLVRHSTDVRAAATGLRLLVGTAHPEDIPLIRTIGLLHRFGCAAIDVLEKIPGAAIQLAWLAERSTGRPHTQAVIAMCRLVDPVTFPWLLRHAVDDRGLVGSHARQVAETVSLADALESGDPDDEVTVHSGKLLQAIASTQDYSVQLHEYADACRAIAGFAVRAGQANPSLDLLAAAVTLAEDLRTGHAACLPWPPGKRATTLERLERLVASPRWAQPLAEARRSPDPMTRWRAAWAVRAMRAVPRDSDLVPPSDGRFNRLAIRVAIPDPAIGEQVETRLLVDGRPVVAEAFRKGAPHGPEDLLGLLAATAEPREVQLAEAYCTEGCCGALHVTISRDGDTVTWGNWRASGAAGALESFRFQAEQYAETIARAVRDHGWEWGARSLARKLNRLLADEPGLLAAWQCEPGRVYARTDEYETIRMCFWHPRYPSGLDSDDPWLQLEWLISVDDTDLDDQAARIIDHLRRVDPKSHAEVVGGSREFADRLGFPWPF